MDTPTLVVLIIAIVAVAIAGVVYFNHKKSAVLKHRFGREYDRLVEQEGSRRRAEAVLDSRQKRMDGLVLRPLRREECDRFAAEWKAVQGNFVDDPRRTVTQADRLVHEALQARGYPMGNFEQQAADISVDHPHVVEDYRIAHDIAERDGRGQATTEDLRLAMQHYRNLFEHVLDKTLVHSHRD